MADLALRDVTKIYPQGVTAVTGFSLEVRDREFIVLLGPSGCGKSTILRLIAGLERLTAGSIFIDGRQVNTMPPRERDVAMVPQSFALYPHLTVRDNVAFALKVRRTSRQETARRVESTADRLGIMDLLDRRPGTLSGGQRQRVALGRAMVRSPRVFLMDEPLSNLDAGLRIQMRSELKRLQQQSPVTTVYVTHDQEEALSLGDRVAVMKEGRLLQCGDPVEVYERPANRFVAGFIGVPTMNFIEGRIFAEGGSLYFDEGSVKIRLPDRFSAALAGRLDQPMVLGIRPRAFSPEAGSGAVNEHNVLDLTIHTIEPLGDGMDIVARTAAGHWITIRGLLDRSLQEGMHRRMRLDMDQVHVFELGEEGVNVCLNRSGDVFRAR